jgi:N-acetylglucosamine-6-phosphate deacetylase
MICLCISTVAIAAAALAAPQNSLEPRPNGPFEHQHRCHAIVGADVVTEPGQRLEAATIIIRDGMIEAVGTDVQVPADARLWTMEDRVIYPGFIEPAATITVEDTSNEATGHWNSRIHPEVDLRGAGGVLPSSKRAALRKAGYCIAATYPEKGILRGTGVIMTTAEDARDLQDCGGTPAMAAAFERGGWGQGGGPGSLMGSIAMMRQTLSDARWYAAAVDAAEQNALEPPHRQDDLIALSPLMQGHQSLLVETRDVKETLRAAKLASEMDVNLIILGSGDEYRDLEGVASSGATIIVPLDYPEQPKLDSIDSAIRVPLETLQAWEQAPTNLRRMQAAGIPTCVTTHDLDAPKDVHKALSQAIKAGLDADAALSHITTSPAVLLGIEDRAGRIAVGMPAHLVVCDGNLFEDDTEIQETWVSGTQSDYDKDPMVTFKGAGTLTIGDTTADATLDVAQKKLTVTLSDGGKAKVKKVALTGHRLTASIDGRILDREDWIRIAGVIRGDSLIGRAVMPNGDVMRMRLVITGDADDTDDEVADAEAAEDELDTEKRDPATGVWIGSLEFGGDFQPPIELTVTRDEDGVLSGELMIMRQEMPMDAGSFDEATGTLEFSGQTPDGGAYSIVAQVEGDEATGTASSPMGEAEFQVARQTEESDADDADSEPDVRWAGIPSDVPFPLGARGRIKPVEPENIRFEHATLWTAGTNGIVENGCLVIRDGHIVWAGPMEGAPEVAEPIVDATGMHITPGLIDCHSHTGIDGGVNEFNESSTARVGIGDVVAGDDMNWYRQLAGGLTAANQLHGSANPIGGRNSVVKLRWGKHARDFPVDAAPPGIKFALGENVKRSSGRYPDTRMGVDAFIRDRLATAQHYAETWDTWNAMDSQEQATKIPPRRDFEMDTLAEIIAGERLIHCHSYRQDEILALLRTCEEFGITIGTLQHILEGYKVADDIARHGAGASSFSDWWAYKIEVMDAIPYNGAIMHEQGVVVSFNSDDSELATRMNDEAAKAVRYGGLPPSEAIKFVTLNPAKQLQIDDRTGSLEAGKDADFVVWNLDPLDSYSLCQQTWIDGAKYFDRVEDAELAKRDTNERTRLVQLVLHEQLGAPPELKTDEEPDAEPAWAANPYTEHADDHRGCCGIPADHVHTEDLQ